VIIGLGVDIAEVARVKAAIERHGETFLRRIYTPAEQAYCEKYRNKFERYAGRFAVKEAAMKALGTGWRKGIRWVDIEVERQKGGKPLLVLHGVAKARAAEMGVKNMAMSITHTEEEAFAEVIFET